MSKCLYVVDPTSTLYTIDPATATPNTVGPVMITNVTERRPLWGAEFGRLGGPGDVQPRRHREPGDPDRLHRAEHGLRFGLPALKPGERPMKPLVSAKTSASPTTSANGRVVPIS